MPTGYTAGILDGTIKTFQQFAKQCVRAFGATIHMRDESFDKQYTPRAPSDYHTKEINEAEKLIKKYSTISDKSILAIRQANLINNRKYHLERKEKILLDFKKLDNFLVQAKKYVPPTPNHDGIKNFMIEQLDSTIKYDGNTSYQDEQIAIIEKELGTMDVKVIRAELIEKASDNLIYHQKEYNKELAACEEANKWTQQFFDSIKD